MSNSTEPAITPQPKIHTVYKSRLETWKAYWDRKKGPLLVFTTATTVALLALNYRNVKFLNDFIHENDLVGLFEDWADIEEELRETPLDWREKEEI